MSRRRTAMILAALIATKAFLFPTVQGAIPLRQAFAATAEASAATQPLSPATRLPGSAPAASAAPSPVVRDDYTTHSLSMQEEKLLNLINQDRKINGLPPLAADPELSHLARLKSEDMRDRNYFAHESPTWGKARQMLEHFGYDFRGVGENIAHHATVEKAQAAFMTSDGHRRNILSAVWEKVGVGVCYDRSGHIYATQLFVR